MTRTPSFQRVPPFVARAPRGKELSPDALCAKIEQAWAEAGHPEVKAWVVDGEAVHYAGVAYITRHIRTNLINGMPLSAQPGVRAKKRKPNGSTRVG